jgi:antitoxin (DNA-binding transcriptional repressor) of toxin-antitoxin stability system
MRVVGVKELKARLSAYLREAQRGETFLVTQRDAVVARLGPPVAEAAAGTQDDVTSRLARLGARPPLRPRRRGDLRRTGPGAGLTTARIDELLAWARDEAH